MSLTAWQQSMNYLCARNDVALHVCEGAANLNSRSVHEDIISECRL